MRLSLVIIDARIHGYCHPLYYRTSCVTEHAGQLMVWDICIITVFFKNSKTETAKNPFSTCERDLNSYSSISGPLLYLLSYRVIWDW